MAKSADAFRTISEVSEWLDTPAHVLRFWESKFTQVKPVKRAGGRRYYRPSDMELLGGIKRLLHDDGMTIKGVQKLLRDKGIGHVSAMSQPLDDVTQAVAEASYTPRSAPEPGAHPAPVAAPEPTPLPEPTPAPETSPEPEIAALPDPVDQALFEAPSVPEIAANSDAVETPEPSEEAPSVVTSFEPVQQVGIDAEFAPDFSADIEEEGESTSLEAPVAANIFAPDPETTAMDDTPEVTPGPVAAPAPQPAPQPVAAAASPAPVAPPPIPHPLLADICERTAPFPKADMAAIRQLSGRLQDWLDRQGV